MSDVYFTSSRSHGNLSLIKKFDKLIEKMGLDFIKPKDSVAIKLHMGEPGNTAFIRPQFARKLVDKVKEKKARPFLTDTVTLYHGPRSNAVEFIEAAYYNGFSYSTVNAPIIIADGIKSKDTVKVEIDGKHFKDFLIAGVGANCDAILTISHVKAHMVTGIGGAIKNIGMGFGSRSAKQRMHADVKPEVFAKDKCTLCGSCVESCSVSAIKLDDAPVFDYDLCVGCAECIAACQEGVLKILWNEKEEITNEKIAEVASGVLKNKKGKVAFFNFLIDITPDCDCFHWNDNSIVPNIGILASFDPVAIDVASVDLVNNEIGLPNSRIKKAFKKGEDKFLDLHPKIDYQKGFEYAEKIGLGETKYNLINIDK